MCLFISDFSYINLAVSGGDDSGGRGSDGGGSNGVVMIRGWGCSSSRDGDGRGGEGSGGGGW